MSTDDLDADSQLVAGQQPPSTHVALDLERIITAAVCFIDEKGLSQLTMRSLGAQLRVEAMALYRYVPGRDSLLDAVLESILNEVRADQDVLELPIHGWQHFLRQIAGGMRSMAMGHPNSFPLVASRPLEAPWLRPPLRNLYWVERFLGGLLQHGFSDEAAVAAYRQFSSFLLGHLLLDASALGVDVGLTSTPENQRSIDDRLIDYPIVARLSGVLTKDYSAAEFDRSLEDLLGRIALLKND